MNQAKTREQIEYERALKNLHDLSIKKALSEEGIDTSKVSMQKLDQIKRLLDSQPSVRQKYQEVINRAQRESSDILTSAQNDMQAELSEIEKNIESIVKEIKVEQGILKPPDQAEAPQEGSAGEVQAEQQGDK